MRISLTAISRKIVAYLRNFSTLEIYTDGSSKLGVGSWAYLISRNGKCVLEKSGRVQGADSNTMEFQAAIEVLRSLPLNTKAILFSDSRILVDAMKSEVGPIAYQAQVETLLRLNRERKISWQWIKAHNGNEFNERCDELCVLTRS